MVILNSVTRSGDPPAGFSGSTTSTVTLNSQTSVANPSDSGTGTHTTTSPSETTTTIGPEPPITGGESDPSKGRDIGIGVAGVVFAAVACYLGFLALRRRKAALAAKVGDKSEQPGD